MSAFKDQITADAINVFADPDFFGEEIGFVLRNGTVYTFCAVVFRDPPSETPGSRPAPDFTVFIPKSADTAKGVPSIDIGASKVRTAKIEGGAIEDHGIVSIVSQDPGGWTLRLR